MPNEIPDLLSRITDDVRAIVADEIALAKAELKPAVRRIGVGSGMMGAAAYVAVSATIVLWFTLAAGFSWLYAATTGVSPLGALFFGTLTVVVLLLIVAGLLVWAGKTSFSGVHGPQKTPETITGALDAVWTGLAEGQDRVAAELAGDGPPDRERRQQSDDIQLDLKN